MTDHLQLRIATKRPIETSIGDLTLMRIFLDQDIISHRYLSEKAGPTKYGKPNIT